MIHLYNYYNGDKMEIKNILDALSISGVESIIQYCECTYNDKKVEFRLINDEFGVIDEIEYKIGEDEWSLEFPDENDEDSLLLFNAVNEAPYEVFHKSDVGAKLTLNHERIKPQNIPAHLKNLDYYVDEEDGVFHFLLIKNVVNLD